MGRSGNAAEMAARRRPREIEVVNDIWLNDTL
jgi:hypothetical protein